jgi:hypothetical protein
MIKAHSLNPGALKACCCTLHVALTRLGFFTKCKVTYSTAIEGSSIGSVGWLTPGAAVSCRTSHGHTDVQLSAQWWSVDAPARASTSTVHVRANPRGEEFASSQLECLDVHAALRCGHFVWTLSLTLSKQGRGQGTRERAW